jgi:hypothetical protein
VGAAHGVVIEYSFLLGAELAVEGVQGRQMGFHLGLMLFVMLYHFAHALRRRQLGGRAASGQA